MTARNKPGTCSSRFERLARTATNGLTDVSLTAKTLRLTVRRSAQLLRNYERSGLLTRIGPGLFLMNPFVLSDGREIGIQDPWVLAHHRYAPCYIGGWTAASHWGLTSQIFRATTVLTDQPVRRSGSTIMGEHFRIFRISPQGRSGLVRVSRGLLKVAVSSPDRTIVDGLNRPKVCGGIRLLVEMIDSLRRDRAFSHVRLASVARKVASGAAWKRFGYLAEHLWGDAFIVREAERHITKGVAKLDPSAGSIGTIDHRWNLLINTHLDKPEAS